ncbi:hypothetical protein OS493_030567 [Desmophyllum pertusum]|uniref:Uncharacterized protein n=1 Tax=Desmophyllum pertusum TaxID=174260 RepID=A0A9X0CCR6_9CNID|nr:hypothetical protein OS493_030567 [Desmophyllum pertusum]
MSINNNGESKSEVTEGKRVKNTPKRRKFRSFSLADTAILLGSLSRGKANNDNGEERSQLTTGWFKPR